ncbi:DUF5916 domain-containing protein [uncultured Dokdonia sp.]|uniref:DUF5916 domain-containing protein n=1 Tax=uncultured Dokdonia sp. TaxID=575653 RepID=UPI00262E437D|nr:DUF5916 domain-containing protein [uncultured Dokdonia sp.]
MFKGVSIFLLLFIIFFQQSAVGQTKELTATRINTPPKIDGILDDAIWGELTTYGDFNMFEPGNEGVIENDFRTEIKMAYDDKAVYIAAYMYDPAPDSIPSQFSQRDEVFAQADNFVVALNTYNDGINETRFYVTSAGTIGDQRVTQNDRDFGFNVVFQCRVSRDDKGWYAEYRIPYNALRFPEIDVQNWSVNFYRRLLRRNETHTWNRIERGVGRDTQYNGTVKGVENIDPPVRLTFFPFAQAQTVTLDGESETDFAGGLDIKYGLSDSFTLDAQLIPDFGQVAFDAVRLNLGPFEQTFSENRPFFTEGIDLFQKGRIFFSRRIGGNPTGSVGDLAENEEIIDQPGNVKLINSVKISGRTRKGLGVGFLNSIGENTFATIRDTVTGISREERIEPLTNYNVFVLDQQFNQNSSVSLINTSVIRSGSRFRDANVTGAVFDIADKGNNYRASGRGIFSNVRTPEGLSSGFQSEFDFRKIKGQWRYRFGHDFANTTLDINDLGLNFRNNFNNFTIGGSYELIQPKGRFNGYRIDLTARHRRLYRPSVQTRNSIRLNSFFFTQKRFAFGANTDYNSRNNDYFEPRVEGRFVVFEPNWGGGGFISTDFRKKFAFDLRANTRVWFGNQEQVNYNINFSPRYRFSDKFLLILSSDYSTRKKNFGWVDNTDTEVFLGLRDVTSFENTITASYNFDPFKAIDLRLRNFWSVADHSSNVYFILNDDGSRTEIDDYDTTVRRDPNTNFNIWNMDLSFRWRFAPGSEATLLYRNQIFNSDEQSQLSYTESLGNLFDQPVQHTVSLRVTYFIDYNNIKTIFKKTS